MKIRLFLFFPLLLLFPVSGTAMEILGVSPRIVHPGQTVRVTVSPFEGDIVVFLGDQKVSPLSVREREIIFKVPDLSEGEYLLFLRGEDGDSPAFRLEITHPPPVIYSLIPSVIDECANADESIIEVRGDHFHRGAALLLDNAAVPAERQNAQTITMRLPFVRGGVHHVQIINPSGRRSLPRAFFVNDQPEIFSVIQGADNVNSYELVIHGKNFFSGSQLLVNGRPIRAVSGIPAQTEIVRYIDCNTLVYVRYPYSRELKQVSLRVINPGGKQSPPFSVTVP